MVVVGSNVHTHPGRRRRHTLVTCSTNLSDKIGQTHMKMSEVSNRQIPPFSKIRLVNMFSQD